MTKRKTKKAPRIAAGLRIRRRNASCQRPPVAVSSAISWASISAMLTGESFRPWARGRGSRGNWDVPPALWRRGLVGETGFPPRERAEGDRKRGVKGKRGDLG